MPIQLPRTLSRASSVANSKLAPADHVEPDASQGRFSIDFSIELERELARMESPPDTPMASLTHVVNENKNGNGMTPSSSLGNADNEDSLLPDPEILSHIVTQLRHSLVSLTQERDTLVGLLAQKTEEEANAKDALEAMVDRATRAEEDLYEQRRKVKEGEEQVGLLRGKVEESRRGLMRLQTENRRQSGIIQPPDANRTSMFNAPAATNSSKRASFTPLTGSRHSRISSITDIHGLTADANGVGEPNRSPNPPPHLSLSSNANGSRRASGLFTRNTPSPEHDGMVVPAAAAADCPPYSGRRDSIEVQQQQEHETLRAEVKALKSELETAKRDVVEANEAREASEMCVQALRGFIKENGVGIQAEAEAEAGVERKVLSTPVVVDSEDEKRTTTTNGSNSGWGFTMLWAGSTASSGNNNNVTTSSESSSGSNAKPIVVGSPSLPPAPLPTSPTLLTRKLTGFFGSRGSRSSASSIVSTTVPAPPSMLERRFSTSATSASTTTTTTTSSDLSSVIEPLSPALSGSSILSGGGSYGGGFGLGVGFGAKFGPGKVHGPSVMEADGPHRAVGGFSGVESLKGLQTPVMSLHEIELDGGDGLA